MISYCKPSKLNLDLEVLEDQEWADTEDMKALKTGVTKKL